MGSWNTGTMGQITNQVVETMERRNIDICCIQETRWHGGCAKTMPGNISFSEMETERGMEVLVYSLERN